MATVPAKEAGHEVEEWTKPPFLRRVRIRGYKSIGFCDVALQPLTILVGRNAAGKSNFLGALGFVRDALATNIPEATKRHGGWHSMLSRFSPSGEISFEVEMSLPSTSLRAPANQPQAQPSAKYGVLLKEGPVPESPVLIREWFWSAGMSDGGDCHYELTGAYDPAGKRMAYKWQFVHPQIPCSQVPHPSPDRLWIGSFGKSPFLEVSDALRFSGYYNFSPQAIRQLQKPSSGLMLERDGRNLADIVRELGMLAPESLQRVKEYVANIAEEVRQFDVCYYGEYETIRFGVHSAAVSRPLELDAASMSDGTLRVLAALMAGFQIVLPHGHPSIVGIEEPETALHPAAMGALVDALDEATQWTQILLTTHSADLLADRDLNPGQVLVVRSRDGQTQIAPVDAASREIVQKELYTLADLQRMDHLEPDAADLASQAQAVDRHKEK